MKKAGCDTSDPAELFHDLTITNCQSGVYPFKQPSTMQRRRPRNTRLSRQCILIQIQPMYWRIKRSSSQRTRSSSYWEWTTNVKFCSCQCTTDQLKKLCLQLICLQYGWTKLGSLLSEFAKVLIILNYVTFKEKKRAAHEGKTNHNYLPGSVCCEDFFHVACFIARTDMQQ